MIEFTRPSERQGGINDISRFLTWVIIWMVMPVTELRNIEDSVALHQRRR